MSRLKIRPHQPWWPISGALLLMAITGGSVYLHRQHAMLTLHVELESAVAAHRQLRDANRTLAGDNEALRRKVAILTRAQQIDGVAYRKLDERLRSLQEAVFGLKEEVAFYRGIVASDGGRGVKVQTFTIDPDGRERGYRFQVVLTRGTRNDNVVAGSMSLSVSGDYEGGLRRFSFREVSTTRRDTLEFRFKYFQRLEGHVTLPESFVPRRVHVHVQAPQERPPSVERHFDWPALSV